MKILGLCFLLIVCLAPVSSGQESSSSPKLNPAPKLNLPKTNQLFNQNSQLTDHTSLFNNSQSADTPPLFKKWRTTDSPSIFIINPESAPTGAFAEPFCAYMRTYRVRREYRGSDEVSPAGYTTCVSSNRFEVRSAVQTEPASPE